MDHGIHIITNNLNEIYLTNKHIGGLSSQHNHPDKLLIALIVHLIIWSLYMITIQKIRVDIVKYNNDQTDMLANDKTTKPTNTATPHIHIDHTISYRLAKLSSTANLKGIIRYLKQFKKQYNKLTIEKTCYFHYIEKTDIQQPNPSQVVQLLWIIQQTTDAQITQTLKFIFSWYMGNA